MPPAAIAKSSERLTERLRVAVVVDGSIVPAAIARIVDLIASAPVDLVAIHVQPSAGPRSLSARVADAADLVDRAIFRPNPDAFRPIALHRIHGARLVGTSPGRSPMAPMEDLDVLVDLTTDGVPARAGPGARLGIWSLRHGDGWAPLSRAAFVSEFIRGPDVAITELVAEGLAPAVAGKDRMAEARVLYRSVGAMDRLSPARSRNAAAWKAAEFPARILSALATGDEFAAVDESRPDRHPDAGTVNGGDVLRLILTVMGRSIREAARRLVARPSWLVTIRTGRLGAESGFPPDLRGFRPFSAPAGRSYADPFLVHTEDGVQLFVEDAPVGGGPGRISTLALDPLGRVLSGPHVVLERSTHLSYPFVFSDSGQWYMLPETASTGNVELFRARRFPDQWEPVAVLLRDIRAADPTLLHHGGLYWLFAAVTAFGANPWDELCVFWSKTLTGPWHPHRQNPVISDTRRARPAGRILVKGGSLIRPAQDCTGGYGRRIVLNRIEVLSPDQYRESPIGSIEPRAFPGVRRTHTYAVDDTIEMLDALRYEPRRWRGPSRSDKGRWRRDLRSGEQ